MSDTSLCQFLPLCFAPYKLLTSFSRTEFTVWFFLRIPISDSSAGGFMYITTPRGEATHAWLTSAVFTSQRLVAAMPKASFTEVLRGVGELISQKFTPFFCRCPPAHSRALTVLSSRTLVTHTGCKDGAPGSMVSTSTISKSSVHRAHKVVYTLKSYSDNVPTICFQRHFKTSLSLHQYCSRVLLRSSVHVMTG